jgi:hypothetical protein
LARLGLSPSGEDTASIFPAFSAAHVLASLPAVRDHECARIAAEANARLEVDRVTAAYIAEAVADTLQHWAE